MSLNSSYNSGRFSMVATVSGNSIISDTSGYSGYSGDTVSDRDSKTGYKSYRDKTQAWWSVGDFLSSDRSSGITHKSARFTLTDNRVFGPPRNRDDLWDLSDSLAEIYEENFQNPNTFTLPLNKKKEERIANPAVWLAKDTSNGFIRVFTPDMDSTVYQLVPCTLGTSAHKICVALGISVNALHVQTNGDIVRRVDPYEHPLAMQNEFLAGLGYTDIRRIQEQGCKEEIGTLIKYFSGKPFYDSTFARNKLQSYIFIRKAKVMSQWSQRLCSITGTRLNIQKDKLGKENPLTIQLARGHVEMARFKGHEHCLKLTLASEGDRVLYLSFTSAAECDRWYKKCKKATDKLPTSADLSNCHLEYLPETIFINNDLLMLNLRHNVLRERPVEDDIYTIGWLDDLSRFSKLRSLNLADNDLHAFPLSLCHIKTLVELNIASNKITEIPADIHQLKNLQALHLHNNHLSSIPDEMLTLHKLFILVLAFNHFLEVPPTVAQLTDVRVSEVENVILAGNQIESLPAETLTKMRHVKKVDFRMNKLTLSPSETMKFTVLEHLTHLDVRDNMVDDLDICSVRTLEYLNCERNNMTNLQINGSQLKTLHAAHNSLETFTVSPKPEWLVFMDLSHNCLEKLPDWLSECFFLQKLYAGHNLLQTLPTRLFLETKKLRSLRVNHNNLTSLPSDVDTLLLEELHLQNNQLTELPAHLLIRANKLKVLNATKNRLTSLPPLNEVEDLNKIQELYLSMNQFSDTVIDVICGFPRLKVLHIAHNEIYSISNRSMQRLEMLHELNVSGNQLRSLPECLGQMAKLVILRAHSNTLQSLPDLKGANALKILDVGHNRLSNVSVTNLMASQLNLLDMSLNAQLKVDPKEFKSVKHQKKVCLIDLTGQNRKLPGLDRKQVIHVESEGEETDIPWKAGFSETSGIRNKLSVACLSNLQFGSENEAAFGVMDGGRNNEVPKKLLELLPKCLREELNREHKRDNYMKYTFLTAHRNLNSSGLRLGASVVLCHIQRERSNHDDDDYTLQVASVGDVEVVMCRGGDSVLLTRKFSVTSDKEECKRIHKGGGIITEDGKVNGTTSNTRQLGCNYMYPHVIPDPHTAIIDLQERDEFLILANQGLWKYVTYTEATEEVYNIGNPVVAAKRLQDLAQAYGSKENIGILVVRLNTDSKPSLARLRPKAPSLSIDDIQAAAEYEAQKKVEHEKRSKSVVITKMDSLQDNDTLEKRNTVEYVTGNIDIDGGLVKHRHKSPSRVTKESPPTPPLKPLPRQRFRKRNAASEWEGILQKRLAEDVKDKEMEHSVRDLFKTVIVNVNGSDHTDASDISKNGVVNKSVIKPSQIESTAKVKSVPPHPWHERGSERHPIIEPNPAYSYQNHIDMEVPKEQSNENEIDRSGTPKVKAAIAIFEKLRNTSDVTSPRVQQNPPRSPLQNGISHVQNGVSVPRMQALSLSSMSGNKDSSNETLIGEDGNGRRHSIDTLTGDPEDIAPVHVTEVRPSHRRSSSQSALLDISPEDRESQRHSLLTDNPFYTQSPDESYIVEITQL